MVCADFRESVGAWGIEGLLGVVVFENPPSVTEPWSLGEVQVAPPGAQPVAQPRAQPCGQPVAQPAGAPAFRRDARGVRLARGATRIMLLGEAHLHLCTCPRR